MMDAETPQIISLFFPPSTAIRNEDVESLLTSTFGTPRAGLMYTALQLVTARAWPRRGVRDESGSSSTHQAMTTKCHTCHKEAPFF